MTLKTIFNAQFVLKRKSEYPEKYFWHFTPFDFENMTFKTIFNAQYVFKKNLHAQESISGILVHLN